jgi:RNA polymerase sigma factor (sigma-70 family)
VNRQTEKTIAPSSEETNEAHAERVEELYILEYDRLRARLCRKAPREVAEDIVAQSFANALSTAPHSVANLRAYVRATAENLLVNYYRDQKAHRDNLVRLIPEETQTCHSLEASAMEEERQRLLTDVIDRLPPRRRMAFQLQFSEGLSISEIVARFAERGFKFTERTVRRDITVGYESCRQALEAFEGKRQERRK